MSEQVRKRGGGTSGPKRGAPITVRLSVPPPQSSPSSSSSAAPPADEPGALARGRQNHLYSIAFRSLALSFSLSLSCLYPAGADDDGAAGGDEGAKKKSRSGTHSTIASRAAAAKRVRAQMSSVHQNYSRLSPFPNMNHLNL
jgi:hypothetical protein